MSSSVAIDTPSSDAAVDVRTLIRVLAVERRRVESGRQPRGAVTRRDVMEASIRAFRRTLAREHPRRVLFLAPVRVDARHVGKVTGQVLLQQECKQVAPVAVPRIASFGTGVWLSDFV